MPSRGFITSILDTSIRILVNLGGQNAIKSKRESVI